MKRINLLVFLLEACTIVAEGQNFNIQLRATLDYPGQTLANVWGYAQDGREYALVGASRGLSIVDVTNPDTPIQIVQIPGPNNLWREVKTYKHYAYVTTEGGGGVQIVDLSKLPDPNLDYRYYTGTGEIAGQLGAIHALHIDETRGFLYTYGGNFNGIRVHDLNADPFYPIYVGKFDDLGYVHDGFVDNDTLYACHIYAGLMSILDMRDKANPKILGTVETPSRFTHNSWILSDRKTVLTTDERVPSFLTAYDVSDPTHIRELDRFSTNDGLGSIVHNTHIINDYAVTSWYTDGVTIVDAHKPDNLVLVGQYDTWVGSSPTFDGCWGVYPFFPSGTIVATNIPSTSPGSSPGRLFVLTPTYQRACYLEGRIIDGCSGQPLADAEVKILSPLVTPVRLTQNDGTFKTGQPTPGTFAVTVRKPGFQPITVQVPFQSGQVTRLELTLQPITAFHVQGRAVRKGVGKPLANRQLVLRGPVNTYTVQTDAQGQFTVSCMSGGNYRVGTWGYRVADVLVEADGPLTIELEAAYYDDFELDLGWTTAATATAGLWERGIPIATTFQNALSNPGTDVNFDNGAECYVTGNAGGAAGNDDVDNGSVTLISPPMQLNGYADAVLRYHFWFFNRGGNSTPNDRFEVHLSNGIQTTIIRTDTASLSAWRASGDIRLRDHLPLTDDVRVHFIAYDINPGHLVEAAVDAFEVVPIPVSAHREASAWLDWQIAPNPSPSFFWLRYRTQGTEIARAEVIDALGRLVEDYELSSAEGELHFGHTLPPGFYFLRLKATDGQEVSQRVMKVRY
ncbi:MAG: choice-of-anchor B family protein [Saprospiraceae bacterium]|nr:choice-of-anchor B family protein [Saprospiraceae bacterium]MDW8485210.1 choice-of-anchor B family protein [Saprospiraceae bacterium]